MDETRPLLTVATDTSSSSNRKSRRARAVVLAGVLIGTFASVQVFTTQSWPIATNLVAWSCRGVVELDLTPEVCHRSDGRMCDRFCSLEGSICKYLCGEACERGVGALCVYNHLSNLEQTCASIRNMTFPKSPFNGTYSNEAPKLVGLDCDYYSYCAYCAVNDQCSQLVEKSQLPYTITNKAAFVLDQMTDLCARA